MKVLLSQSLSAAGVSNAVELAPGQALTVHATTANLANATLYIRTSRNGSTWENAKDDSGAAVPTLVGTAGTVALASTRIANNTSGPIHVRGLVVATGSIAGAVALRMIDSTVANATPGPGIYNGVGTVHRVSVVREGTIIRTKILVDLTGLNCGGTADDIIGVDGAGAAYIYQLLNSVNGAIFAGSVTCYEVPVTGNADVDLWSANEATGIEDSLITALSGEVQLTNGGAHTLMRMIAVIALPVDGQYLYLTCGASTAGTYTAGILEIELIGFAAE